MMSPVARFQAVASGVGGIIAVHFFDVLDTRGIAHKIWQRANQLDAIVGEQPLAGLEHLVHQHPAAHAVVVRGNGTREIRRRRRRRPSGRRSRLRRCAARKHQAKDRSRQCARGLSVDFVGAQHAAPLREKNHSVFVRPSSLNRFAGCVRRFGARVRVAACGA